MRIRKLRPLLPACHSPHYLHPAMISHKCFASATLPLSPTAARSCKENLRNLLKTRISGGGGEGGSPIQNPTRCHPERSESPRRRAESKDPFLPGDGGGGPSFSQGLLAPLTKNLGAPSLAI